jgi:hypothetical protein
MESDPAPEAATEANIMSASLHPVSVALSRKVR